MKKITFIILSFLLPLITYSQIKEYEFDEIFLDADSWLFYEEFQDALPLFLQVYKAHPENANVNYKIGLCYLNIEGQKYKSIPYLEKAILNTTSNYRKNTYIEKQAPLDSYFYLGNAYLINNQIKRAQENYNKFEELITENKTIFNKDNYNIGFLKRQKQSCETAIKLKQNPVNFIAINLGTPINTQFSDLNAVVSADGNSMIFTSELKFYNAIFYSIKENGKWSYPINLMGQLKVDNNTFPTSLSKDGTELFLYRKDDYDGNIYYSSLKDGIWSQIKKLEGDVNTKYWESHATISSDGKELYFVSNRDGGIGDLDIYVAQQLNDGTWGKIKNIGSSINTQWNENTPFLSNDGNTLFFSSEGHNTMGGYDVFYSRKINGIWQEPINIGYPINTTDNNSFFVPSENEESAYFSFFSKKGYGKRDIFEIKLLGLDKPSNIKVEGIAKYDDKIHNNKKDFTISIIDTLLHDTIAILSPEKDLAYNEYKTPSGENHLLFESYINSENNTQILISQNYKIKNVFLNPIEHKKPDSLKNHEVPEINIDKREYITQTDNQKIKIKLSLQKGSQLFVSTFLNNKLINSEEFNVKNGDFIYEYKPVEGKSKIKFKLLDKNKNVKTEEILVSYIPSNIDSIAEFDIVGKTYNLKDGLNIVKIKLAVEKESKLFVKTYIDDNLINSEVFDITKDNFTYEFVPQKTNSKINFKMVDSHNNFKTKEVIIANEPLEKELARVLIKINKFNENNITKVLNSSIKKSKTESSEEILKVLYNLLDNNELNPYIIAIALSSEENAVQFKNDLLKLSEGNIKQTLTNINNDTLKNQKPKYVLRYLISESDSSNYSKEDISNLVAKYLVTKYKKADELISELNKYASFDIQSILQNVDETAFAITSIKEFSNYILSSDKFSKNEKEIICSMISGINISLLIQEEDAQNKIIKDNKTIETDTSNKYTVLFIVICFLALVFIFIYLKKKRRKR